MLLRVPTALAPFVVSATLLSRTAAAQTAPEAAPAPAPDVAAQVDLTKDMRAGSDADDPLAASAAESAPPPAPYRKTVVLDSSIGVLAFLGTFGKVAPPGPLLRVQLGYELARWLMVFGEGELAFSDTSNREKPPDTRAFPLFGFGAGVRGTVHPHRRLGVYLQAEAGALKADIKTHALGLLGFEDAESLGLSVGGHLGVEWYQVDRHFALGLNVGFRVPTNFDRADGGLALAIDGGAALRYAF